MKTETSTENTAMHANPSGSRTPGPCLSYIRPAIGETAHEHRIAGNRMSDATSGGVLSSDCMKVGTMMFMAKIVSREIMFTTTPMENGAIFSGARLMSGSSMRFCRRTKRTMKTMPMTKAAQAMTILPLNTVDTP